LAGKSGYNSETSLKSNTTKVHESGQTTQIRRGKRKLLNYFYTFSTQMGGELQIAESRVWMLHPKVVRPVSNYLGRGMRAVLPLSRAIEGAILDIINEQSSE